MLITIINILNTRIKNILTGLGSVRTVSDSARGCFVFTGIRAFATQETSSGSKVRHIDSYRFGQITVNGQIYNDDVIVFPERVRDEWWRQEGHSVKKGDIEEILEYAPEMVIFGTGATGRMDVPDNIRKMVEEKGIEFVQDITREACRRFDEEMEKGKKVVGAFHLTC